MRALQALLMIENGRVVASGRHEATVDCISGVVARGAERARAGTCEIGKFAE